MGGPRSRSRAGRSEAPRRHPRGGVSRRFLGSVIFVAVLGGTIGALPLLSQDSSAAIAPSAPRGADPFAHIGRGAQVLGSASAPLGAAILGVVGVGSEPTNVTWDSADDYLYVTNFGTPLFGGNTVSIASGTNFSVVRTVGTGDDPIASVFDPSDRYVYVLNYGITNNLTVINGTSVVASIPVGLSPQTAVYDRSDGDVYVSNTASANVSVVNGTAVVASVAVGSNPARAGYDGRLGYVYVPNAGSNNVSILHGSALVATVPVGLDPTQAIYDPQNGLVYVVNSASSNVSVFNGTTVATTVAVGTGPGRGVFDPANGEVYLPNSTTNSVFVLSGTRVVANVSVGVQDIAVFYDAESQNVYAIDQQANQLTVLNGTSVTAYVSTGVHPIAATYDPSNRELYVPNFDSLNVSVLGTPIGPSTVSFVEHGLPAGAAWGARIGATTYTGNTSTVVAFESNGTYNYSIPRAAGYAAAQPNGTVRVQGTPTTVKVTFEPTFPLIFSESGLAVGVNWSVSIGGARNASSGPTVQFAEPNGTYGYTVGAVAGYDYVGTGRVTINGSAVNVSVTFRPFTYRLSFHESGLTPGTRWAVQVGATTNESTSPLITFAAANGSYHFRVPAVPLYLPNVSSGYLTVNGSGLGVSVGFTPLYEVLFLEGGLPSGSAWTVRFGALENNSTDREVGFEVANGSYAFHVVTVVPGCAPTPASGNVTVLGGGQLATVRFTCPPPPNATYNVTFSETGLPPGTSWTVELGPDVGHSMSSQLVLTEPNGSYAYGVVCAGYVADPPNGTVVVSGPASVASPIEISFSPRPAPLVKYLVRFQASNLSTGTRWSVTLDGSARSSTTNEIDFSEWNGTYPYSVAEVSGYYFQRGGVLSVRGTNATVAVPFERVTYAVQFEENGLPAGTVWSVTLGSSWNRSTTTSLTFREPNGSYPYNVTPVAGFPTTAGGTVVVNGSAPPIVQVAFAPSTGEGASVLGLSPSLAYGLIGGIVVVAAIGGVALLRRKGRRPVEPPPATEELEEFTP